jgi:hypothetical protein
LKGNEDGEPNGEEMGKTGERINRATFSLTGGDAEGSDSFKVPGAAFSCRSSSAASETSDSLQVLEMRGEVRRGSSRSGGETGGTGGFGHEVLGKALERFSRSREQVTSARRRWRLVLTAPSCIHVNSLDSSGTLVKRARSRSVDSRNDRGTSSGMLGTCGEEGRRSGDSSRDSSDATNETLAL